MTERWHDSIVNEIHRIREKLAAEHGNDLHAIVEHLRRRTAAEGRKTVTFQPRPASFKPEAHSEGAHKE